VLEYIGNEFTFLLPGELIVTKESMKISTILGSCVSVCLFDAVNRVAGMNHYLLPVYNKQDQNIFRFGDTSLDYMLRNMLKSGAKKMYINARVYGGSAMFGETHNTFNVGRKNIDMALNFLKQNEIDLKSTELGGNLGRKIVFDTSTGIISGNYLKSSADRTPPVTTFNNAKKDSK
jgi:chemotaxis protein CheD